MMVKNLMIPRCLQWDAELLNELFSPRDVVAILSLPLCPIIVVDHCIWHYSKSGEYNVRSAYRLVMERLSYDSHLHVLGDWHRLWQLKIPSKVKKFIWRFAKEILPNMDTLHSHGVDVPLSCFFFFFFVIMLLKTHGTCFMVATLLKIVGNKLT